MLTKNSIVLFSQTFDVIWMREQQDLLSPVELVEEARLAVVWRVPPNGRWQGEDEAVPRTLFFASADRAIKVDNTIKEIVQVRAYERSTTQGLD